MQEWFMYAMIAAIFIGVKDLMTKDISKRYSYIEYILIANIMVFVLTLIYIFTMKPTLKKPDIKDGFYILIRLCIIFLIIEPCMFLAIKSCDNPGYAKSIINLNTLFVFILAFFFLKAKIDKKKILGILLIFTGSYYIS